MKRTGLIWLLGCVVLLSMSNAWAQGKFSVQFDDTPLNRVLEAFKRFDANLQFTLAPNLGDIKITASLVDVTVDAALGIVLDQAGLRGVKDNGVYQISEKPEAKDQRTTRPAPRFPPPVFMNRPTAPGEGGDAAAGAAPGAAGAAPGAAAGATDAADLPLRLIVIKYADPADMAFLFGGDVVEGGGGMGGGSGGSSGYGGSSSGGSSGYGSSGSSRGSSGGSSRGSSGGSSRGSSGGSSRGSSSRSSY